MLLSLDASKLNFDPKNLRIHRTDHDFPVAWTKMYGKGRVFYSTLGHTEDAWQDPDIRKMYFEAIKWALGMAEAAPLRTRHRLNEEIMKRIGMGLAGPGFIAPHHIDAVRRLGDVDVIAIAGSSLASAEKKAQGYKVERAYGDYHALLADPDVQVIHNTTPNHLHLAINLAALKAGKHVISDKPLAMNSSEGKQLRRCRRGIWPRACRDVQLPGQSFGPAGSRHDRPRRSRTSELHPRLLSAGLSHQPDAYTWRLDPSRAGASNVLGDIGSHWCDLAEHVSGLKIVEVLAELTTVVPTRYSASGATFSKQSADRGTPIQIQSEDLATVLLRFENGAKGCFSVGQTLPGHKNDLQLELNGSGLFAEVEAGGAERTLDRTPRSTERNHDEGSGIGV